jgi:hypothetical protein
MNAVIGHIPGTRDCREKLLKNPVKTYSTRPLSAIGKIAVHHSLTLTGSAESFARYHIRQHGWPGIGYHFVIEKNGKVKWCNDLTAKSYHVGKANGTAIGICLVGDFRKEGIEDKQLGPLMKLLRFLQLEFDLRPEDVLGHNEFPDYGWKKCPCIDMQAIRDNLSGPGKTASRISLGSELQKFLSPEPAFDPNQLITKPGESVIAAANRLGMFDQGEIKARNKTIDLKNPLEKPLVVRVKGPEETIPGNVEKLIHTLERLGHKVFRNDQKPFNLNIVGIRNDNSAQNSFDDEIHIFWKYHNEWNFRRFRITTDPGLTWLLSPLNESGTAILKEGQYPVTYRIGLHRNKYAALVQANPVTVIRDFNRDSKLDFESGIEQTGFFGINIHRASASGESVLVDKWSAGCQVFANIREFNEFLSLCRQATAEWNDQLTYTLIRRRDMEST